MGVDPSEKLKELLKYRVDQQYPWPVAEAPPGMLSDYRVTTQATKVAIDRSGTISFRAGYGQESAEKWRQVFQRLAAP